jgi:hypothetical protein
MGKITNQRRKAFFEKLAEEDEAKGRIVPKPAPQRRKPAVKKEPKAYCCIDKYEDLPGGFKLCIDCPKLRSLVVQDGNGQPAPQPSTGLTSAREVVG